MEYTSLINFIETLPYDIHEIKTQYIKLLSKLSNVEPLSDTNFMNKIYEISQMGDIIICYVTNTDKDFLIIGAGTITFQAKITHGGKYVGRIEDIVIDSMYQNIGISNNIMNHLLDYAKNKGCYKTILNCNSNVEKVYENFGFKKNGIQMSKYF